MIGVVLAGIVFEGARRTESSGLRNSYDMCAQCGKSRVSTQVVGVPLGSNVSDSELSRWLQSFVPKGHRHTWVHTHTGVRGWRTSGVGCASPEEARLMTVIRMAHEDLGDDPALARLVSEFVSADVTNSQLRRSIVDRASALRNAGHED